MFFSEFFPFRFFSQVFHRVQTGAYYIFWMILQYLSLYLPLPPQNIKWRRWSVGHLLPTGRHQQKSIWPGHAVSSCHLGSEGSFQPLSVLDVLQPWPCHQIASHLSQGLPVCSGAPCTHAAPFPCAGLWRPLVASVFFFKTSYSEYFSENKKMFPLSYSFWPWELRQVGLASFFLTCLHSRLSVYFWADVLIANYI